MESQDIVVDEEIDIDDLEELKNNISDTQPRFVLLSWVISHKDGRKSYPIALIFITPRGNLNINHCSFSGFM